MISQVRYNSKLCQNLLQVLIFVYDNSQILIDDFIELTGDSNQDFSDTMQEFTKMLSRLDLNVSLKKSKQDKEEIQFKKNKYLFNIDTDPYKYNTDDLLEDELIRYSLVIVYLMLKNGQYVTSITLSRLFPNFDRKKMMTLKDTLLTLIADDIDKNKYQSLILVDYE